MAKRKQCFVTKIVSEVMTDIEGATLENVEAAAELHASRLRQLREAFEDVAERGIVTMPEFASVITTRKANDASADGG
jgi:hypothetical protein